MLISYLPLFYKPKNACLPKVDLKYFKNGQDLIYTYMQ